MVKNIVLCLTEVILNKTRVEMYEFSFKKLHGLSGNRLSDCPKVSEKGFESRAEQFLDNRTNSARLGFRSDKRKILGLGSAVGRTNQEFLSE